MTAAEITDKLGLNQLRGRKVSALKMFFFLLGFYLILCFFVCYSGISKVHAQLKVLAYMKVSTGYRTSFLNKFFE